MRTFVWIGLLCLLGGCGAPQPPTIVVYLVDTLRRDHLEVYGYSRKTAPQLAAFAADAVRFDQAYTPSSWTRPAVASLLTGLNPAEHGARTRLDKISTQVPLIGDHLRPAGYHTAAFVSNVNVVSIWGFERGFDHFVDIDSGNHDAHSDEVTAAVFAHLDSRPRRPHFLYVHTRDPHRPYAAPPPFDERWPAEAPPDATNRPKALRSPQVLEDLKRYDGEVGFNDDQFGKLLDRLKSEGTYRDSLIVFTADHGEEFNERGVWGHGKSLFGEVVRIPLLIKLPGNAHAGTVIEDRTSLIDLLPTLLAAAGIEPPGPLPGRNLLPVIEDGGDPSLSDRAIYLDLDLVGTDVRTLSSTIVKGNYKFTTQTLPEPATGLWNLESDPDERDNLIDAKQALRDRLSEELAAHRNTDPSGIQLWYQGPPASKTGDPVRVTGTLRTSGRFYRVRDPGHEADDLAVVHRGRDRIDFDFRSDAKPTNDAPDRDGLVFIVSPPESNVTLEALEVSGVRETPPVYFGAAAERVKAAPVDVPISSTALAIVSAADLFAKRDDSAVGSVHLGVVGQSQGKIEDLADPIADRLRALGYLE